VKGGIIITDDYRSPLFPGNQKAWEKLMFLESFSQSNVNKFRNLIQGGLVN